MPGSPRWRIAGSSRSWFEARLPARSKPNTEFGARSEDPVDWRVDWPC